MATLAFGAAGAAIGSIFPGGAVWGWSIGTVVGGLLFPPGNDQQRGRLDDLRVTGSAYGVSVPMAWGRVRLGGLVVWSTQLQEHKSGGGGKGGPTVQTFSYTVDMAVLLCQGPITKVNKIWGEDMVIYDDTQAPKTKYNVTVYLGDEVQAADPTMAAALAAASLPCPAMRGYAYVVFQGMDLTPWGGRVPNLSFDLTAPGTTAGAVVSDVLEAAGLAAGDIDVAAGTDAVDGYVVPQRGRAKDLLEPLMQAVAADLVEVDGKMAYRPRGGLAAASLPAGDLGAVVWGPGGAGPETAVATKRKQERELPVSVEVAYFSSARQFQQASQRAVRVSKNFQQDAVTVTLPMSMTDDAARQVAERRLYTAWIERDTYDVKFGARWLWLAPGDVAILPVAGGPIRARLVTLEHEPFGLVGATFVKDDSLVVSQAIAGGSTAGGGSTFYGPPTVASYGWNGTALKDSDADSVGLYLAACGPAGWGGVTVWMSRDGGSSWVQVGAISDYSVMGATLTDLPDGSETAEIDASSTVDVQVTRGQPTSVGMGDLLAGSNACVIGREVVQYETVTAIDIPAGKYRLSNLLRGQRGSDAFWAHSAGDEFVALGPAVVRVVLDPSAVGKDVLLKFVGPTESLGSVSPQTVHVGGYELLPYAGTDLRGSRASGDLTATWIRRARTGASWADYKDADLGEASEAYEVDVMSGAAVVRTISSGSPSVLYTSAQQVVDFGSPQAAIALKAYQLGSIGRGFPLEGTV